VGDGLRLEDVPVRDEGLAVAQTFHEMAGHAFADAVDPLHLNREAVALVGFALGIAVELERGPASLPPFGGLAFESSPCKSSPVSFPIPKRSASIVTA